MKKFLLTITLILICTNSVISDMDAVLSNGIGARGVAMGMAQVASAKGADSIYWNPAALVGTTGLELTSTAADVFGTSYRGFSFAMPAVGGNLGFMVLNAWYGNLEETVLDTNKRPVKTGSIFTYDAKAFYLSYAKEFGKTSAGVGVKYLNENLYNNAAGGVGVDAGVILSPTEKIKIGAKIENIIPVSMKWSTPSGTTNQLSTKVRVGTAIKPKDSFEVTGDVNFEKDKGPEFFFGGEYRVLDNFSFRGGILGSVPTFGLGFNYHNLKVDYGYTKGNDYLEDAHRVNLSFVFGQDQTVAKAPAPMVPNLQNESKEPVIEFQKVNLSQPKIATQSTTPQIVFYAFGSAFPGKKFYFKVLTPNVKAERVSVVYGRDKIPLYSADRKAWKGDFTLRSPARIGVHHIDIYVADTEGHLYKEKAAFKVEPLPEVNILKSNFTPGVLNTFEAKVKGDIVKASLVLDGEKIIPLEIENERVFALFSLAKAPKRKILYLADKNGHLFTCRNLNVVNKVQELSVVEFPPEKKFSFSIALAALGLVGICLMLMSGLILVNSK